VHRLPGLLSMTWDSILVQRDNLWMDRVRGDELGMVASVVQMVILALPLLTTVAMLMITAVWTGAKVRTRHNARRSCPV
jgi:hypothetical protein